MPPNKTYTRLSDGALERIMRDVLDGMQAFSTDLAKPIRPQIQEVCNRKPDPVSPPLPRCTSLCSLDLFGAEGGDNKT
jgi:hypothetical protein